MQDVWKTTGYHHGYWTRTCEEWFATRQNRILEGTLKNCTRMRQQWKSQLKGDKRWRAMAEKMELIARDLVNKTWCYL